MKNLLIILSILALHFICGSSSERIRAADCVDKQSCSSHDFRKSGKANSHENLTLSFAIRLKNIEEVYRIVDEVSNPQSSSYGKYWSAQKLNELTFDQEAMNIVLKYLRKYVEDAQLSVTPFGSFVEVKTNVKTAEKILKAEYHQFESLKTQEKLSRTIEFELPEDVSQVIDFVYPTIQFPSTINPFVVVSSEQFDDLMTQRENQNEEKKENEETLSDKRGLRGTPAMTPKTLNSFYNITSNVVKNSKASQSVFATLGQSFSGSDLSTFQSYYGLPQDSVDQTVGTNSPSACTTNANNCLEASLDVQYLMSIAQKSNTTFWSTSSSFATWMTSVSTTSNPPLVHSISYGGYEEQTSSSEQTRFSQQVSILGAQGITVVVASGDDGVSNYGARSGTSYCGFHPAYPANVPYVLSVGATMGAESGVGAIENACQSDQGSTITSGGGFSTIFTRPSYQTTHVQQYLTNSMSSGLSPPTNLFASSGRAYPDVAIAGNNFHIVVAGRNYVVSGTSASAPVFAAILTLVNNARLNAGKPSVGFVNPALYQLYNSQPSIFHDVTSGNNRCSAISSSGSPVCCQYGFSCMRGWDPVTGLGSVNVGRLIQAMVNM